MIGSVLQYRANDCWPKGHPLKAVGPDVSILLSQWSRLHLKDGEVLDRGANGVYFPLQITPGVWIKEDAELKVRCLNLNDTNAAENSELKGIKEIESEDSSEMVKLVK